jgi:hypothetical protein
MKDGTTTPVAIIVGAFAVICCAGPFLIAAIGTAALTGWLTNSMYLLAPAVLIALALGGLWFYRRRTNAHSGCDPIADNKAQNHE